MKRIAVALFLVLVAWTASSAAQGSAPNAAPAAPPRALTIQFLEQFYVRQITQEVQPTDEQFAKLLPLIHQFFQNRYNIAERRSAAQKAMMDPAASDSERADAKRTYDQTTRQAQTSENNFRDAVDPILNGAQQVKFRLVQQEFSQRIQSLLNKAKELAQQQEEERIQKQAQRQQKQQDKQPRNGSR